MSKRMGKRAGLILACLVILVTGAVAATVGAGQPPAPPGVQISNTLQAEVRVTSPPSTGGEEGVPAPTPVTPPGAATPVSDQALAAALEKAKETGVVALATPAEEKVLALTATQLQKVAEADKPAALAVSGVTFTLPPAAVKALAGAEAAQVEVAAAKLAAEEARQLVARAVNAPNLRLIGDVFELNAATVARDGARQAVERFAAAIRVSLPVPEEAREAAAAGRLDAHRYNEAANTWEALGGSYAAEAGAIVFETDHLSKYAVLEKLAPPVRTFADIRGHWAQKDIEVMAGLGIVGGVAPDRFDPNDLVTRAQFAALVLRSLGVAEIRPDQGHFRDVKPGDWYYGAVEAARAAGLVGGYPDGTFRPQASITREEIASMVHRALAYAGKRVTVAGEVEAILAPFADAREVGPWARESVAAAVKERILRGRTATTIVPKGNATRAEAVVMLKRMLVGLGRISE